MQIWSIHNICIVLHSMRSSKTHKHTYVYTNTHCRHPKRSTIYYIYLSKVPGSTFIVYLKLMYTQKQSINNNGTTRHIIYLNTRRKTMLYLHLWKPGTHQQLAWTTSSCQYMSAGLGQFNKHVEGCRGSNEGMSGLRLGSDEVMMSWWGNDKVVRR